MIERETVLKYIQTCCEYFNLKEPELMINDSQRGGAKIFETPEGIESEVVIPVFVLSHGDAFCKYYVVHECTHLVLKDKRHGKAFKEKEQKAVLDIFGIDIKYNRSFPKCLYDSTTKAVLWGTSNRVLGTGMCLRQFTRKKT